MDTKIFSYTDLVDYIIQNGTKRSPRGITTYEIRGCSLSFESGLLIQRKNINHRLALLESAMLLGGFFDIELIKKVAPRANHSLYEKQSDYGTRLAPQYERVLKFLEDDRDTRRAVLFFNNRNQDASDIACTTSMQFFIEKSRLSAIVNVRSWDAVFGLPMDIVMYSSVLQFFSELLGKYDGRIVANVGSLHVYESTKHLGVEVDEPLDCSLDWNFESVSSTVEFYKNSAFAMADDHLPFQKDGRYHGFRIQPWYTSTSLNKIEFTKINF